MRLGALTIATATAVALVVAPATAHAAKKPVYKVSISTSTAKADVGQTIKVSGKVRGPKAAKMRLAVQVKVGAGKWKTVKKVRTTKKNRYATAVKVTTAGQQQLRVVAPKSKKARQGVSKARGFVGWRWLDLTAQAKEARGSVRVGPVTIAGKTYAKAITLIDARLAFNVNDLCDTFTAGVGVKDGIDEGASVDTFVSTPGWGNGSVTELAPGAPAKALKENLKGIYTVGMIVEGGVVSTVDPTAHCSVNTLPNPVVH